MAGDVSRDPLFVDRLGMSPYGVRGRHLGEGAIKAADALADEPDWDGSPERRWVASDYVAFNAVIDFVYREHHGQADLYLQRMGRGSKINRYAENMGSYADNVRQLHLSLPFTEGERYWIADQIFGTRNPMNLSEHVADAVRKRVALNDPRVHEAGRQRRMDGDGLMDTFWAWRRQIFEFDDAVGSLDFAIDALRSIGQILHAYDPTAASYDSPFKAFPYGERLRLIREARQTRRASEMARATEPGP